MYPVLRRLMAALRRRHALWAAWRRLTASERRDFLMFAAGIPAVALSLRVLGFRRTQRELARLTGQPLRSARERALAAERALLPALRRARRYAPYRGNCLSQSLTLWWGLRRRGVSADLRLGVQLNAGVFAAHAWVEAGGRVLNDRKDVRSRFEPFHGGVVRAS